MTPCIAAPDTPGIELVMTNPVVRLEITKMEFPESDKLKVNCPTKSARPPARLVKVDPRVIGWETVPKAAVLVLIEAVLVTVKIFADSVPFTFKFVETCSVPPETRLKMASLFVPNATAELDPIR